MTAVKNPRALGDEKTSQDVNAPLEAVADKEQRHMPTAMDQHLSESSGTAGLDAKLQTVIGTKLKAMFDEVANAPIPDKFIELLSKLDGQEKRK
jgi:Anti-sigma factor NepR